MTATADGLTALARGLPGRSGPLRVLVLGDAGAAACRAFAAAGHQVRCCPDGQRVRGGPAHVDVVAAEVGELTGTDARFDLAVAVDGWARVRRVHPPARVDTLVDWLRTHADVVAMAAPRQVLAPDLNDLGPFEVLSLLGRFAYLAEAVDVAAPTPIVLASDRYLRAGREWVDGADVEWIDADVGDAYDRPVRTYRLPGARIVKVECTSEDYFERAQVAGEAAFLSTADHDTRAALGLPEVHALCRGRAVTTLVRAEIAADEPPAIDEHLHGVLDAAVAYSARGLFHNDVRPWNVLWPAGVPRLIDYADVSVHDEDVRDLPQVLALAGTLAAIATDEIRAGAHFHEDVLAVAERAGLLERWPLAAQLTGPWLTLPARRPRVDATMSAARILHEVLAVTCG